MEQIYKNEIFLIIISILIFLAIIFLLTKAVFKFLITTILTFVIFFGATQSHVILEKYGDKLTPTEKSLIEKINVGIDSINRETIDENINKINKLVDDSNSKIKDTSEIIEQAKSYKED